MPKAGLTAVQYRDQIVKVIYRLGTDYCLSHKYFVILYSGPSGKNVGIAGSLLPRNNKRSREMVERLHGSRINDT